MTAVPAPDSKMSCPVDHAKHSNSPVAPQTSCPVPHDSRTTNPLAALDSDSCPYSAERQEAELLAQRNNMPPLSQQPAAGQKVPLSVEREHSSIPMAGQYEGKNWIYPSEQMFFNAMRRKNWTPSERDMSVVVPIHNAVNEQCWHHVRRWEAMHQTTCATPKLVKFRGRPKDTTPKAFIRHHLLGYSLPFDRHDWTVDRCGKTVEYVIDFYGGPGGGDEGKPSFFLDVRPKLSLEGIVDRVRMWWTTGEGIW
ncbi:hypothetical protein HDU86_002230 [Geranomyces michiganensis]|nr:hypothetical protein HDU86_002230 [Geranomyces michiganensis]